jgi:hypothetical protein
LSVVWKTVLRVLRVGRLAVCLVDGWDGVRGLVRRVLLGMRGLLMLLLVSKTRGSRVLKMLSWRGTLLVLVGVMLHREKTH